MVTTLGAAFAAAAVAVVADCGFWMTTLCAVPAVVAVLAGSSRRGTTPAPAPPPISAPATRPAMPIRSRPERRAGAEPEGSPPVGGCGYCGGGGGPCGCAGGPQ